MWTVDRENFPTIGVAFWWAIQTVTTVGYGDVTPTTALGRFIGSFVLIESIAFLSIVTAVITSTFVEQARQQRQLESGEPIEPRSACHGVGSLREGRSPRRRPSVASAMIPI